MKELASRWRNADEYTKLRFNDMSNRMRAQAAPASAAPAGFPLRLNIRDEKALDALSKQIAAEAIKGFWEDLCTNAEEQTPIKVQGRGTMRPEADAKSGRVSVTLKAGRKSKD